MNDEEVNKIIAEFMEIKPLYGTSCLCTMRESCPCCNEHLDKDRFNIYTESLDAFIPVWEKLDSFPSFGKCTKMGFECGLSFKGRWFYGLDPISLQKACAEATAKVILETKK